MVLFMLWCQPSTLLMMASETFHMGTGKGPLMHVSWKYRANAFTSGTFMHTGYSKCDVHTGTSLSLSLIFLSLPSPSQPLTKVCFNQTNHHYHGFLLVHMYTTGTPNVHSFNSHCSLQRYSLERKSL